MNMSKHLTCKDCRYYIDRNNIHTCARNIVGTIRENDGPCYIIQYTDLSNKYYY